MAAIATIPTTAPAAIAAVLDFGFVVGVGDGVVVGPDVWPGAVTTTVLAFVITDGGPLVVGLAVVEADDVVLEDVADEVGLELELELELPPMFPTELSVPVKYTDQVLDPPPTI